MVEAQSIWKWPIAVEGFLGATGAGTYIVSRIAPFFGYTESTQAQMYSLAASLALVILCLAVLFVDLGRKDRAFNVLRNPRSPMTIGSFFLSGFLLIGFISLGLHLLGINSEGPLSWLGIALALGVLLYPGILFGILKNIPLWNSMFLPILFIFSGIASGGALFSLLAANFAASTVESFAIQTSAITLAVYGLVLLAYMIKMSASSLVAAKESIRLIVRGQKSAYFWGGAIVVGLVVPSITLAVSLLSPNTAVVAVAGLGVIVGSLTTRYLLLVTAVPTPMRFLSAILYPKMKE